MYLFNLINVYIVHNNLYLKGSRRSDKKKKKGSRRKYLENLAFLSLYHILHIVLL